MTKANEGTTLDLGLKAQISTLERAEKKLKKELEKVTALYEKTRQKLMKAYPNLIELIDEFADLEKHGTKKAAGLRKRIKTGTAVNAQLTSIRNEYQAQIERTKEKLNELAVQLMVLRERELSKIDKLNEVVTQVFALNDAVVQASAAREDCLKRHVFPHLLDDEGNMRRQVTFQSSDGLRKVVAMVNTMTIIRGDLAEEAQREIQRFFDRFQNPAKEEPQLQAMLEITRQLLVTKSKFTVGPLLYRFITMDIDEGLFPELAQAQRLIKQSIRSEKTNSYIRLFERKSTAEKFVVVPQS